MELTIKKNRIMYAIFSKGKVLVESDDKDYLISFSKRMFADHDKKHGPPDIEHKIIIE